MTDSSCYSLVTPLADEVVKEIQSWDYVDKVEVTNESLTVHLKDYGAYHQKLDRDLRALLRTKIGELKGKEKQ